MKYLRLFQTVAEKQAATLDYPNVNYTIENDSLEIIAKDPTPAFGGLTVKYNIVDPTQEVTLFNGGGGSSTSSSTSGSGSGSGGGRALPTRMIVDGVEEVVINTWRFKTAGEHIVQYTFADNIIPAGFLQSNGIATEAIVGDDITEIANSSANVPGAFENSSIRTVTIGTGITAIGDRAFHMSELETLTVKADTPPTLGSNALADTSITAIYVPAASLNAYKKATGWSDFSSSIQSIS